MKKFFLLLFMGVALMSFAPLQSSRQEMVAAFKEGKAEQFIRYFDNALDIKMPQTEEMKEVQKVQAASVLKSFFVENGITGFEVTSQRELGGTMYVTGKLLGTTDYNLTAMIKSTPDRLAIITLRINK